MSITWKECTEERYDEMLGVLPPAIWNALGFLVGEPVRHSPEGYPMFAPFAQINGKFYEGSGPITAKDFIKLTVADILK